MYPSDALPTVVNGDGAAAQPAGTPSRLLGTVKSFQGQWGFLNTEGVEGDIFVHLKECPGANSLRPGEIVEFDLSSGGPNNQARAANVRRTGSGGEPAGGSYTGTIASYRQGWGLIDSPSLQEKLFCGERDNPALRDATPMPGDEVSFDLGTNTQDGRSKAVNVVIQMKEQSQCVGQRVRGTVKRFRDGWGFVASSRFSGDILLGKKNLAASGIFQDLQVGETLEFDVSPGSTGQFEATNICKAGGFAQGGPPAPAFGGMPTYVQPPPPYPAPASGGVRDRSRSPFVTAVAHAAPTQGRVAGTVKTFRNGWGFLVSDQVQGDIYVNECECPSLAGEPLQQGEAVVFDLTFRAGRGADAARNNGCQAVNVERAGAAGAAPMVQRPPVQVVAPGPPAQRFAAPAIMSAPPPATGSAAQQTGTLVEWKDGWGWIQSSSVHGQIFFGLRDNPHLTAPPSIGEFLQFELGAGPKGRTRALNVTPSLAGQRVQGVVATVKEGWGFASSDQVTGSVMLGTKNLVASGLDPSRLQVGEIIEFEIGSAPKGYEALNIRKL